ncbi:DUF2252 family protein [Hyphomicrobium sp. LHD-15]|uniref:DUF2252 family protein n=1 Tax=Hyphomicrobium sp. LHD-15 TaxID=3072142 RepID=UPI00280C4D93|nr:DUF2252 family protein [Hyphomicrobium sp. LHD-15]MDQ8697212.1 DUF2252 family protein [Hyphomicrobium sp. LHD-15]
MSLLSFAQSKERYESWLQSELGPDFVAEDLAEKNQIMRDSAFVFLRGTYWRWAEIARDVFSGHASAPAVLAVGDIHLENFGTWRDADGRLVWGINDFDEAARMPYVEDLVRLATSAALAADTSKPDISGACDAVLGGYRKGLEASSPVVLDRDWAWLREKVVVSEESRQKFWKKIDARKSEPAPPHFHAALQDAMPQTELKFDTARRVAGTGSLGRSRWIGVAEWRGAPIVREAKTLLPSAWNLAHGERATKILTGEIAGGRYRSPDPWMKVSDRIATRRLSPNNRKIEAASSDFHLQEHKMLSTMGFELANVHAGTDDAATAIETDLATRKSGWLAADVENAMSLVLADYKQLRKH